MRILNPPPVTQPQVLMMQPLTPAKINKKHITNKRYRLFECYEQVVNNTIYFCCVYRLVCLKFLNCNSRGFSDIFKYELKFLWCTKDPASMVNILQNLILKQILPFSLCSKCLKTTSANCVARTLYSFKLSAGLAFPKL